MKKLVSCILLVGLLFSLFGCGDSKSVEIAPGIEAADNAYGARFSYTTEEFAEMYGEFLLSMMDDEDFSADDEEIYDMAYDVISDLSNYDITSGDGYKQYIPKEDLNNFLIPSFKVESKSDKIEMLTTPVGGKTATSFDLMKVCIAVACNVDFKSADYLRIQAMVAADGGADVCYGNIMFTVKFLDDLPIIVLTPVSDEFKDEHNLDLVEIEVDDTID